MAILGSLASVGRLECQWGRSARNRVDEWLIRTLI
eukprot:SAG11_NODE_32983_length_279_cov_1.972222_1_plen_34_part_10